jgi:hypothetical protein
MQLVDQHKSIVVTNQMAPFKINNNQKMNCLFIYCAKYSLQTQMVHENKNQNDDDDNNEDDEH